MCFATPMAGGQRFRSIVAGTSNRACYARSSVRLTSRRRNSSRCSEGAGETLVRGADGNRIWESLIRGALTVFS